jgi:hypothetical protein
MQEAMHNQKYREKRKQLYTERSTPKDYSKMLLSDIKLQSKNKDGSDGANLPKEPITPRINAQRRISQDSTLELKNIV